MGEKTKVGRGDLWEAWVSGYRAGSPAFILVSVPLPLRTPLDELFYR